MIFAAVSMAVSLCQKNRVAHAHRIAPRGREPRRWNRFLRARERIVCRCPPNRNVDVDRLDFVKRYFHFPSNVDRNKKSKFHR